MGSHIAGNLVVCSTACSANTKENIMAPHYWPYIRWIHCWWVESPHKEQMIRRAFRCHYSDVIMTAMAFQITSITIVYSTVYSGTDQWTHQSSGSLAFVMGIHRWPVNSPHKGPVTRKMFPFDDVIMPWRNREMAKIPSRFTMGASMH